MSLEGPTPQDKKPERMLADKKGNVVPEYVARVGDPGSIDGKFRFGEVRVPLEEIDKEFQTVLNEARAAGVFGAEPTDNLVAEMKVHWWENLGSRMGVTNPDQTFLLDLVGEKGTRREAIAAGRVSGNKIKEIFRVYGVVANHEEKIEDGQFASLLIERGCPQELVDGLKKLYEKGRDLNGRQMFGLDGIFVDPSMNEYVVRGSMNYDEGQSEPVEVRYKKEQKQ